MGAEGETKMKKIILVVEDEESLLNALYDKLIREGFNVAKAKNGEEGLQLCLTQRQDLTLLDVLMPKMDGMTMLKKIREDKWGKTAKVIMLTNLSEVGKISEALNEKVTDYLVKSDWHIDDVVKKIRERLEQQPG